MNINIVAHCWSVDLPFYSRALTYMLSSLVLHEPKECQVTATICCCPEDDQTIKVIRHFRDEWNLNTKAIILPREELTRRSIGRNIATKCNTDDIMWFADVDQVYRDGILDRLATMEWPDGTVMIHPREIMIHRDHATGDRAAELVAEGPRLIDIAADEFVPKRYKKAIGGVQIVQGDFARKHGYLDGYSKWQRPFSGPGFDKCRCDLPYRRFCRDFGKVVGVDLKGMYRLRHTVAGHGRPCSKKPIGSDGVEKF